MSVARAGLIAAAIAGFALCPALAETAEHQTVSPPVSAAAAPALAAEASIPPSELEPFVDGIVRAAMARDRIAGVTVAVVQDGHVILKAGFGFAGPGRPVDPDRTLFRIGSISKTFTWIATMKQVEAGRMRLDGDINEYVPADVAIAAVSGWRAVELRDLMSHTPGFEDRILGMFAETAARIHSLHTQLKLDPPRRVFPPGTVVAYSNFGVMLAGEAVSHMENLSFPDAIEREITSPLRMDHTSFREPYPARAGLPAPMSPVLAANLSTPYRLTDGVVTAQPTEWLTQVAPAGGGSSTAGDMARYMLMILQDGELEGVRIYNEATAAAFRTPIHLPVPNGGEVDHGFLQIPLPGGFMGYGHDGETLWFQSNMVTVPALRLGIFVSSNTDTGLNLGHELPQLVVAHFYGPPEPPPRPKAPSTVQSATYAGTYIPNRRPFHGLQKFLFLLTRQWSVEETPEGYLVTQSGDTSDTWAPTAQPGHFQAVDGPQTTDFANRDGAMQWYQPGGTESLARVGPIHERGLLFLTVALAAAAAVGSLTGAAMRFRKVMPATHMQQRLNSAHLLASAAWLVSIIAMTVFADDATNLRNLIFGWPGAALLTASYASLLATLLSLLALIALPFVWIGEGGWGRWRKIRFSASIVLFCALGAMLAIWGFLQPWDP